MPSTDSFPTKRGTARFTDDVVQFDESFIGYVRSMYLDYWQSDSWWRKAIFVGYVLAFPVGLGGVVRVVRTGNVLFVSIVAGLFVILWLLNYVRGFRSPTQIRLDAIEDVSGTHGKMGLTRPRIIITYSEGDSTYKRRVNLPSLYTTGGEEAFEQAQAAFAERGF